VILAVQIVFGGKIGTWQIMVWCGINEGMRGKVRLVRLLMRFGACFVEYGEEGGA
jgi:hypothetical protein